MLLGKDKLELIGKKFSEVYQNDLGETIWMNLFYETILYQKPLFKRDISQIINKEMFIETYPLLKEYCVCEIINFKGVNDINNDILNRANKDYLTGLYNRFYLNEYMTKLKPDTALGIALFDLNNLKKTNDTLGHIEGDRLIKKFVSLLNKYISKGLLFRIGGDEFLSIIPDMKREEYEHLMMDFKEYLNHDKIAAMGFVYYDSLVDIELAIDECDKLMYFHKKAQKGIKIL